MKAIKIFEEDMFKPKNAEAIIDDFFQTETFDTIAPTIMDLLKKLQENGISVTNNIELILRKFKDAVDSAFEYVSINFEDFYE